MKKKMMTGGLGSLHGLQHRIRGRNASCLAAGAQKASLSNDENRCNPFLMRAVNQLDPQGMPIDNATYASLVRWCGNEKALLDGRRLHEHIRASGRDRNTFLANLLVQMYGKCGSVKDARNVFDKIGQPNMFSWNFMTAAYVQNGHDAEALHLYTRMQMEGVKPNKFTFLPILSASANLRALANGKQIHERIVAYEFGSDVNVKTALVNMYGKCGSPKYARAVFDEIDKQDLVSWNTMIAAYAQNGHGKEALELFRQMDFEGLKPDRITFLSILVACASSPSLENGRVIHERIIASGFESDVAVRNALVNMYGKCGSLQEACAVFDKMHERDVISWTAMIAVYAENGHGKEALELFRQMNLEGVHPNRITFLSALDACASLASLENAYAQNGCGNEALKLFRQMDLEGIKPNKVTFLTILNACASLASLENGKAIHELIVASGSELDVAVMNALINMYGKCGSLNDARIVFDEIDERDVISWNAMIAAYAQSGHGKEALQLFRQMVLEDVKPDMITFLNILNACSHAGLLDLGWQYFVSMCGDYGITPSEEHYACMSDLLGRVGSLDEAEDLIINMLVQPSAVAWNSLLGACRIHGDVERGTRAAENVFELDPADTSPYILLSNILAAVGRWDDASKVRKTMEEKDLKWKPGCCYWIEAEGTTHDVL